MFLWNIIKRFYFYSALDDTVNPFNADVSLSGNISFIYYPAVYITHSQYVTTDKSDEKLYFLTLKEL